MLAASVFEAVAAEGIERVGIDGDVNHRWLATGQGRLDRARHVRQPIRPEPSSAIELGGLGKVGGGDVGADVEAAQWLTICRG